MPRTEVDHGKARIIPFKTIAGDRAIPPHHDEASTATTEGVIIPLTEARIQRSEGDNLPSYQRLNEKFRAAIARLENLDEAIDICDILENIANVAHILEKHPEFKPDLSVWRLVNTIKGSANQSVIMNHIHNYPSLVRLLGWAIRGECHHPAVGELGRNVLALVCQCQHNAKWDFTTGEVHGLEKQ
ncbi:hypothetical protein [Candidatus Nanosynbacter lyticus]|uniref:hypothetical protein n=1 Tax=Candidatus Nanosynbacter lyticus TaxID=2093824 RepID=UPI0025550BFF|nr:hypothetical protein [Candidatus Nanosynbacter lyticus]WLD46745.1 hypothetical protein NLML1_0367 [Candidatus Nanosynbacter lyticus]